MADEPKKPAAAQTAGQGRGVASDETAGKFLDRYLTTRIWKFIRPHRGLLWLSILLMPVSTFFNLAQPIFVKMATDSLDQKAYDIHALGVSVRLFTRVYDVHALGVSMLLFMVSLFIGFGVAFAQNATMILAG